MEIKCSYTALMKIEEVKKLINPKNPNEHSKEQIERLAQGLEFYGWRHPVIVSKEFNRVEAGHGRIAAAEMNGYTEVPVDIQSFSSEDEAYAFMVFDNAIQQKWAKLDLSSINLEIENLELPNIELLGLKDFALDPSEKDAAPSKEKMVQCPKCANTFNTKDNLIN